MSEMLAKLNERIWTADNEVNAFESVVSDIHGSNEWVEKINGQIAYRFELVKYEEEIDTLLIFDSSRGAYILISPNEVKFGKDTNEMQHAYTGKWMTKPRKASNWTKIDEILSNNAENLKVDLRWIADNNTNVFERVNNMDWVEKINGNQAFEFKLFKYDATYGLVIFDASRHIFIVINSYNELKSGNELNEVKTLYNGEWQYTIEQQDSQSEPNQSTVISKDISSSELPQEAQFASLGSKETSVEESKKSELKINEQQKKSSAKVKKIKDGKAGCIDKKDINWELIFKCVIIIGMGIILYNI